MDAVMGDLLKKARLHEWGPAITIAVTPSNEPGPQTYFDSVVVGLEFETQEDAHRFVELMQGDNHGSSS